MNCHRCQEQLLADPQLRTPELRRHLEQCAECRHLSLQVERLEEELQRSIRQPGELPPLPDLPSAEWGRRWLVAGSIAALLLLSVALVVTRSDARRQEALAVTSDILHHLATEPQAFDNTQSIDPSQLLAVLGARLEVAEGWYATFADPCKIRGTSGLHIVYRKDGQLATIILLPGKLPVDESHVAVRYANGMTLVVIPPLPAEPRQLLAGLDPVLYPL
ncbi:MAG TPA: DUF3379 family protein [Gammaproteobacteria bacterium]|nr:DUF3379 family protein [Gammaproteobacteria bacterium]